MKHNVRFVLLGLLLITALLAGCVAPVAPQPADRAPIKLPTPQQQGRR